AAPVVGQGPRGCSPRGPSPPPSAAVPCPVSPQRWRTVSAYHAMRWPQDKISPVEREGFALDRALTLVVLRASLPGPPPSRFLPAPAPASSIISDPRTTLPATAGSRT